MPTRECKSIRRQIHAWMDDSAAVSIPAPVADHIRHCSDCHLFIKQWNAVEVGMVSMRGQTSALSPSFAMVLNSRLDSASQNSSVVSWFRRIAPPRQAKLALMGGSAALLALLCCVLGAALLRSLDSRSAANIASSSHSQPTEPATPIPAQIPLAPR
jgi:hypothetical protein